MTIQSTTRGFTPNEKSGPPPGDLETAGLSPHKASNVNLLLVSEPELARFYSAARLERELQQLAFRLLVEGRHGAGFL